MKKVNNVGFTLIELLVVVLIIGILAAVALPQYTKAVEKSRSAEAMQMLGDIATAESLYYMAQGKYTSKFADLDLEFPKGADSDGDSVRTTNSYTITLTGDDQTFSAAAARKGDGTYGGNEITISLDNTGKITRGYTSGKSDICALTPTWAACPSATTTPKEGD